MLSLLARSAALLTCNNSYISKAFFQARISAVRSSRSDRIAHSTLVDLGSASGPCEVVSSSHLTDVNL